MGNQSRLACPVSNDQDLTMIGALMKNMTTMIFTLGLLGVISAQASNLDSLLGTYSQKSTIALPWIQDKDTCLAEGATWQDDAFCTAEASNSFSVSLDQEQVKLRISTIGHNSHMCEFDEVVQVEADGSLSFTDSELPGFKLSVTRAEQGAKVDLTYGDDSTWLPWCGANASLDGSGDVFIKD